MGKYNRVGLLLMLVLALFAPINAMQGKSITPKACPVPAGKPQLDMASDLVGYTKAIESFLSQGGTAKQLEAILIERRLSAKRIRESDLGPLNPWTQNRGGVREGDMNGDGYLDVVTILSSPDSNIWDSDVFVYFCSGTQFHFVGSPLKPWKRANGEIAHTDYLPKFIFCGDMNNDEKADLIYDIGIVGASTIFTNIQIINWNPLTQKLESLNDGDIIYPIDSGTYFVTQPNNRGFRSLIVRTGFSGSGIASGPQRQHTITYSWNGTKFIEANIVSDPPTDRLHAAYDGLYHLNKGHLDEALRLYWRALYDKQLKDWADYTRSTAQAHAAYGIIVASAKRFGIHSNEARDAVKRMAAVERQYEGNLWFKYAHLFWETAQSSNDIHAACKAINDTFQRDLKISENGRMDALGLWPFFSYDINWFPNEKGLLLCPF